MEPTYERHTWKQFKEWVEAAGVNDADRINYIDWGDVVPGVTIERYKDHYLTITGGKAEYEKG